MKKLKCTITYDGTNFSGSQIQPNKRTVQREIENVLTKMHKGNEKRIVLSGRTDAGVHARGQVFHVETDLTIPIENWKKAMNAQLPDDIYVHKVEYVKPSFHARYDAKEKEYRYFVLNSSEPDLFQRNFTYFDPFPFDLKAIKEACKLLEGTHDFTSFSSARSTVKGSKVRTLYEVSCLKEHDKIVFTLRGNGFLYNMVRIIVGALLDVGKGILNPSDIEEILQKKDRSFAGKTMPPQGLFLWKVTY